MGERDCTLFQDFFSDSNICYVYLSFDVFPNISLIIVEVTTTSCGNLHAGDKENIGI